MRAKPIDLADELTDNIARTQRYVAALKSLLVGLQDADPFGLPDWDWQWPAHAPLALSLNFWNADRHSLSLVASSRLQEFYDFVASTPPPLDTWIDGWNGSPNVLISYLVAKLRDYESTMISKAQAAQASLDVVPQITARTASPPQGYVSPTPLVQKLPEISETVLLAGAGRSGTTWVSNVINYDNRYRYMWEPFHGRFVPMCRRFTSTLYLRPDDQDEELLSVARTILAGEVRNAWIDRFNRAASSDIRLIKECRANLWLAWLKRGFPNVPIVLLMRHPCAVANSRLALEWPSYIGQFLGQDDLVGDYLDPFRAEIERADTALERQIFAWCIQHYVPLRQLEPDQVHLIFYENLWSNPKEEISRLFSFLGRPFDYRAYLSLLQPSQMSRGGGAVTRSTNADVIESWRKHFTEAETQRAIKILKLFGLDAIYSADPRPSTKGARAFMLGD